MKQTMGGGTGPQPGLFCWMETLEDQSQDQPDEGLPESGVFAFAHRLIPS